MSVSPRSVPALPGVFANREAQGYAIATEQHGERGEGPSPILDQLNSGSDPAHRARYGAIAWASLGRLQHHTVPPAGATSPRVTASSVRLDARGSGPLKPAMRQPLGCGWLQGQSCGHEP